MEPTPVQTVYIGVLLQKTEVCNQRIHQTGFWFLSVAVIGYFLSKSEATTLSILGTSVPVPRTIFVGATPLVLAALYYSMSCFIVLEAQYNDEIGQFFRTLQADGQVLSPFQLKLLEAPSVITYEELRDIVGTTPAFRRAGFVATLVLVFTYVAIPACIVGYFVFQAFHAFGVSWVLVLEGLAVFLGLFAFLQLSESLQRSRT